MPVPFIDEALRDHSVMPALIQELFHAGVLGFRSRRGQWWGSSPLPKAGKENELKLVVVSCVANALHRPPPHADNCRFLPKAPGSFP